MLHIGDMVAFYYPSLWRFENTEVYSGEYTSIILHGGSDNFITNKIVTGILHHYHTDQLVTENNH
jgi:hypothetical protein